MLQKALILLVLVLPAIPALWFMASLLGLGQAPTTGSADASLNRMNPIAAVGWGFGVYFVGLTMLGLVVILLKSIASRGLPGKKPALPGLRLRR